MNQLKMKARSGVTLVELLVVILIVTILSVSMLPLLQPFVTESQYAAEAIPVIANLRTKIGLYSYDKGVLPAYTNGTDAVQTWVAGVTVGTEEGAPTDTERFGFAYYNLSGTGAANITPLPTGDVSKHLGRQIDVDYQDLKGKRSKPPHYQYYPLFNSEGNLTTSYVIGCFGDGSGLKAGTGYAVCELNYTKAGKKYIGTWKRYKPNDDATGALQFGSTAVTEGADGLKLGYCYVPASSNFNPDSEESGTGEPAQVQAMKLAGWEF